MESSHATIRAGYKQTDVGVIPEDWDVEKFKNVTDLITCGIAATPEYVSENAGVAFLSSTNIKEGKIQWANYKHISKELHKRLYKNNPPLRGDILYSRVGTIGEAAIIDVDYEFSIYVSLTLIKTGSRLHNGFLKQLLNSPTYKERANREVLLGSGVGNLNVNVVREFPIPVPPTIKEQQAIAEVLSDMDTLITSLDQLITKKLNIKQGAMQLLLTGKKRLAGFSGEWETKTFAEIAYLSKNFINPQNTTESLPCIELEHISQETGRLLGFVDSKNQLSHKAKFSNGDVLFGKLRPYLKKFWLAKFDGVCSTEIWVIKTVGASLSEFVFYLIQSDRFIEAANQTSGTKMPRAEWKTLKETEFEIPPTIEEQKAIARILSDMDAEIEALEKKREKYKAIKQGMMQELLTGKTRLI